MPLVDLNDITGLHPAGWSNKRNPQINGSLPYNPILNSKMFLNRVRYPNLAKTSIFQRCCDSQIGIHLIFQRCTMARTSGPPRLYSNSLRIGRNPKFLQCVIAGSFVQMDHRCDLSFPKWDQKTTVLTHLP